MFRCKGPDKGTIPPGEHVHFVWTFHPIEAKAYEMEVPITLGNLKTQTLLLQGRGFMPDQPDEPAPLAAEGARCVALHRPHRCTIRVGMEPQLSS